MQDNNVIIIIPIHKESMNWYEIISFRQCIKIMHNRVIRFIAPEGLGVSYYTSLFPKDCDIDVVFFPSKFFYSGRRHGQLLISKRFYRQFSNYSYILIHHLDAYVFKDELDFWCSKDLDYIGAPWFKSCNNVLSNDFVGVGNGGFSLRKVSTILSLLHNWKKHLSFKKIIYSEHLTDTSKVKILCSFILASVFRYQIPIYKLFKENEDFVLGVIFSKELKAISTPLPGEASAFAFEMNPAYLFELNDYKLPFGCHAWNKYETDFWRNFIPFPFESKEVVYDTVSQGLYNGVQKRISMGS
jgi:Protein of unknown function (DUF5672)